MTTASEATAFPVEHSGYAHLREILHTGASLTLSAQGAGQASIPEEVANALDQALAVLEHGDAVAISARKQTLTTQQAAEVLGVSRPTLIKYLDQGEIAHEMRGRHRRVDLKDVLDFQDRKRETRRQHLDLMDKESEEYRPAKDAGFTETR